MTAESFAVDLRSLTDFAHELATQLGGMTKPLSQLESLVERELRLGAFGEALALGQRHHDAVAELHTLVTRARDAIEFAQEVTGMVGNAYQNYDNKAAGALGAVTGAVDAVASSLLSIVDPKA
ncbi:hypothetical protein [Actinophytocola sp.]|uniref:hypothetical protein n=1 Tax=Actinophytocola sp. TaxID=1872138 RepID=UPI002ECFCF66